MIGIPVGRNNVMKSTTIYSVIIVRSIYAVDKIDKSVIHSFSVESNDVLLSSVVELFHSDRHIPVMRVENKSISDHLDRSSLVCHNLEHCI